MTTLTEERKQQIIAEEPGGLWLVLDEEHPRDVPPVASLLSAAPDGGGTSRLHRDVPPLDPGLQQVAPPIPR